MSDFKAAYDRVLAAQADLDVVTNEIESALTLGTPEGDQQALDLSPKLEEAQKRFTDLDGVYKQMQATATNRVNAQFVPVSNTATEAAEEDKPKVLTLAAYNQLTPRERLAFAKSGGTIE